MERSFLFNDVDTWCDWNLILTAKDLTPPEAKTYHVDIDGMDGTIDLSESLAGEVRYKNRTLSASFWTDYGDRKEREELIAGITSALHGKKVKITDPDDSEHYLYGRVKIKSQKNILPYAEIAIEAECEPWRYAISETDRRVDVDSDDPIDVVINNNGVKTLCPVLTVKGSAIVVHNGISTPLLDGSYQISDIKLRQGVNVVRVSGHGSVVFTYTEAIL